MSTCQRYLSRVGDATRGTGLAARRALLGLTALLSLVLLTAAFVPVGSSDVRDVAARFQPPADATSYQQRITPARLICLDGSPCPSLFRSWTLTRRLEPREVNALLLPVEGSPLLLEGDCRPDASTFARVALCTAAGEVGGYAVTVTVLGESRTNTTVLTLDVRPAAR